LQNLVLVLFGTRLTTHITRPVK